MDYTTGKAFREIPHSGGYVKIHTDDLGEGGTRRYSLEFGGCCPNRMAWWALYVLPPNIALATIRMGGIGDPISPSPVPGAIPVVISSDSTGAFGRLCPRCKGYWRDQGGLRLICPYCGMRGEAHNFITDAQAQYIDQYLRFFTEALAREEVGTSTIDLDVVADAAHSEGEKPPFYYSEEGQQLEYTCPECGAFNDVRGTNVYCCGCGSRNDLVELVRRIEIVRKSLHSLGDTATCLRSTVSCFDGAVKQLVDQLIRRVPLRPRIRAALTDRANHNLLAVRDGVLQAFQIDIFEDLSQSDVGFAKNMFARRHVHEHNNGLVDIEYMETSGDESVRIGQTLEETSTEVQRLTEIAHKMVRTFVAGFHELFPPLSDPIKRHKDWESRTRKPPDQS